MKKNSLILSVFFISAFAQAVDNHSAGTTSVSTDKKKSSQKILNCIKDYKLAAAEICREFRKLDLSPKTIAKARGKIKEIGKSDNMWWSEQRIKEAQDFLDGYKASSSMWRVGEERWCTLALGPKSDEYEKSMAWTEERCKGDISEALSKDAKELEELTYMLGSLSNVGLAFEAQVAKGGLRKIWELKKRIGAFTVVDVDRYIQSLAQLKEAAATGTKKDKEVFDVMLKECYAAERAAPEAFKAPRKGAPQGYDCASFDSKQNP
jgi:hypothetical protein